MGLKETLAKYPRLKIDTYVQQGGKRNPRMVCEGCGHRMEINEKYHVVTTEYTFMRGDDESKVLCDTCAEPDFDRIAKGEIKRRS